MRDHVITAYLKDFVEQFGLQALDESTAFENFVNYIVISKYDPDPFEPEDVGVGGSGDLGLDGLGIIVNDHLVRSESAVDHFKKALRRLDVQFLFVQTKTSPHFDSADMGTFIAGVRRFFEPTLPPETNPSIAELHKIKNYIFANSIDMDHSPHCRLYYATTGTWVQDMALRTRMDQGVADLKATGLFSHVEFHALAT